MRSDDEIRVAIEAAAEATGNNLGWRLFYSSPAVDERPRLAIIGLNPGGGSDEPWRSVIRQPEGQSAYVNEFWAGYPAGEAPLQKQVQALCRWLGVEPADVLAGNLIPFRSPRFSELQGRAEALRFGEKLWKEILAAAHPELIVTLGIPAYDGVARALGAKTTNTMPIGWGTQTARIGDHVGGRLIGLPHLSQYKIFSRPQCHAALVELLGPPRG